MHIKWLLQASMRLRQQLRVRVPTPSYVSMMTKVLLCHLGEQL